MKRILMLALALGVFGYVADRADAHGGSFRGPNGGVPPGLREPSDPEPPPPPPSDPGDPTGPVTPNDPAPAPTTPTDTNNETPGGDPAPTPVGPTAGPQKKTATKSLTFESWRFWWGYNCDDILNLKSHIYAARTSSSSPIFFSSKKDEENRRNATRPTERAVEKTIIPALLATINRPSDHEDVQGGALVALGKVGTARYIPMFQDAIWGRYKNEKDQPVKFGLQATESAVLALGLLPNVDDASMEQIRKVCIEAIDDDANLRTRERAWAAVVLGLLRDKQAVRPLVERLKKSYKDENIPAGILCGIGLIGNCEETQAIREGLQEGLTKGTLFGTDVSGSDRMRSFIGYALMKIGDPRALNTMLGVLDSRKQSRIVKRSAAIAAGALGALEPDMANKEKAVAAITKYLNNSGGDATGENFGIIALSQIATDKALETLMDLADNGQYGQRPFAALGLGTRVFYNDRDAEQGKGEKMDSNLRKKIVATLAKLSDKYKDADTKAAFMLARGLVKDKAATEELVTIASSKSGDSVLRGFCCVALGLMGDASEPVKDALKIALDERKSPDLRRDAATGLGLLRDADVVKLLLNMLQNSNSFAVQGQLITAIGFIGDHTAIPPLVQILDDTSLNTATRAMAAVGLGMIGDLRELPPLARLSQNYNYRASVPDLDELLFIL
jgi:HEAT repeat protein